MPYAIVKAVNQEQVGTEAPSKHGEGLLRRFERGVDAATRNNITAYGYSVTITAAFGILSVPQGSPGIKEILAFAGGAVIAFALIGGLVSGGFREELEDEPSPVKLLGSAFALICPLVGGLGARRCVYRKLVAGRLGCLAGRSLLDDGRLPSTGGSGDGCSAPHDEAHQGRDELNSHASTYFSVPLNLTNFGELR